MGVEIEVNEIYKSVKKYYGKSTPKIDKAIELMNNSSEKMKQQKQQQKQGQL